MKKRDRKEETNLMVYTYHQLFATKANTICATATWFGIYLSIAVITFFTYLLIRYASVVSLQLIVVCVVVMGTLILKLALTAAISCHISSNACCVFGRTSTHSSNLKYIQRLWKSRQKISICIGNQYKLETKSYVLHVFGTYIPDNLVNLLLAF